MKLERCFIDTNLFLRFLTNDVPAQAEAVERLFRRAAVGHVVLVTSTLVIAEIVWTLESYYQRNRDDIRGKLLAILSTSGLEIERRELILQAIVWYADSNMDFIDAYNAGWMLSQEITTAYTFDRKHFGQIERITVRVPGE